MCTATWKKKMNNNFKKENHFMLKLGSHPEQSKFHAANLPQRQKINKFLFGCWDTIRKGNRKANEKLKINPKLKFPIISVANCNESNTRNNQKKKKNNCFVYGFDTKSFIAKVLYLFCLFSLVRSKESSGKILLR